MKSEQANNTKGELTYHLETGEPLIDGYPMYSGLPKREWVDLTREEEAVIIEQWRMDDGKPSQLCRMIEAKMKEKNQ
jgi:hypothetical protein